MYAAELVCNISLQFIFRSSSLIPQPKANMTEPIEIDVNLQISPCSTKLNDSTTIQAFNGLLADFVATAIEQSDDFSSYDVIGQIESQSIHQQDGVWSRMERFFRKFYTKRLSGDPVGSSRMEVKEVLTLSSQNSTLDAATEEGLSDLIMGSFADDNSVRQLRIQLLTSEGTKSFFSEPRPIEVVALKQNRNAGVKLAPLLGSIGVIVVILAFVIRFSPRRWRSKLGKRSSEYTSRSSSPPPELIDISNDLSSIGVDSPASVYLESREAKVRRKSGQPASAMMQELPPIPEETDYDFEQGPANNPYRRDPPTQARAYPPTQKRSQDVRVITVVVGPGYPEELGFTIFPGPEALEINEILNDSPLPLRVGDMIAEVDGHDVSRWNATDFEEYLVERRRHNKTLLIARSSNGRDDHDDCDDTHDDGTRSYFTEGYETECEDETMMDDSTYYR